MDGQTKLNKKLRSVKEVALTHFMGKEDVCYYGLQDDLFDGRMSLSIRVTLFNTGVLEDYAPQENKSA